MHDFATKRNALFACLDDASNELKGTSLDQTNALNALKKSAQGSTEMVYRQGGQRHKNASERKLHQLRGKESIFKKPELPIARCLKPRKLPDYQINPHKWQKYSLEDVDISEQTNSSAAFEFLRKIDEQKDSNDSGSGGDGDEKLDQANKKIEFKKSSKLRRNLKSLESQEQFDAQIDSPKLKGSKLVMPEYVVGQKKPGSLIRKPRSHSTDNEKKERAAGKLLLSHLAEDDEDIVTE